MCRREHELFSISNFCTHCVHAISYVSKIYIKALNYSKMQKTIYNMNQFGWS